MLLYLFQKPLRTLARISQLIKPCHVWPLKNSLLCFLTSCIVWILLNNVCCVNSVKAPQRLMVEQAQVSYSFTASISFPLWVHLVVCLSSKTIATTEHTVAGSINMVTNAWLDNMGPLRNHCGMSYCQRPGENTEIPWVFMKVMYVMYIIIHYMPYTESCLTPCYRGLGCSSFKSETLMNKSKNLEEDSGN